MIGQPRRRQLLRLAHQRGVVGLIGHQRQEAPAQQARVLVVVFLGAPAERGRAGAEQLAQIARVDCALPVGDQLRFVKPAHRRGDALHHEAAAIAGQRGSQLQDRRQLHLADARQRVQIRDQRHFFRRRQRGEAGALQLVEELGARLRAIIIGAALVGHDPGRAALGAVEREIAVARGEDGAGVPVGPAGADRDLPQLIFAAARRAFGQKAVLRQMQRGRLSGGAAEIEGDDGHPRLIEEGCRTRERCRAWTSGRNRRQELRGGGVKPSA